MRKSYRSSKRGRGGRARKRRGNTRRKFLTVPRGGIRL